jgi:phospholipid/cholesterol/gamma-HCH transport system substrate-binding protein
LQKILKEKKLNLKIKREIKVGILVILSLAFFYWGFNFLKGRNYLSKNRIFYAVYSQVNGLLEANSVMINGLKVGEVNKIAFMGNKGRMLVKFSVENDIEISANSIVRIFNSDILGSRAIEIILRDSVNSKGEHFYAKSGDTLMSDIQASISEEVSAQMLPIKMKAESLLASLDSVISVVQYIFNENTRENLMHSFESIKFTIKNLEHATYNIDTLVSTQRYRLSVIFANIESITANFKNNNSKLTNVINNFSDISDSLSKARIATTINKANNVLKNFSEITEKIDNGKGSLGLLINNDSLYNELSKSSKELNLLLEDLRLNPHRYVHVSVFGKNPKKYPYKVPEEKK